MFFSLGGCVFLTFSHGKIMCFNTISPLEGPRDILDKHISTNKIAGRNPNQKQRKRNNCCDFLLKHIFSLNKNVSPSPSPPASQTNALTMLFHDFKQNHETQLFNDVWCFHTKSQKRKCVLMISSKNINKQSVL